MISGVAMATGNLPPQASFEKRWRVGMSSFDMPITLAPAAANWSWASAKARVSSVQPWVEGLWIEIEHHRSAPQRLAQVEGERLAVQRPLGDDRRRGGAERQGSLGGGGEQQGGEREESLFHARIVRDAAPQVHYSI
jgi:hypothetical protein